MSVKNMISRVFAAFVVVAFAGIGVAQYSTSGSHVVAVDGSLPTISENRTKETILEKEGLLYKEGLLDKELLAKEGLVSSEGF